MQSCSASIIRDIIILLVVIITTNIWKKLDIDNNIFTATNIWKLNIVLTLVNFALAVLLQAFDIVGVPNKNFHVFWYLATVDLLTPTFDLHNE